MSLVWECVRLNLLLCCVQYQASDKGKDLARDGNCVEGGAEAPCVPDATVTDKFN